MHKQTLFPAIGSGLSQPAQSTSSRLHASLYTCLCGKASSDMTVKTNLHGDCISTPRERLLSKRWMSSGRLHMCQNNHGASSNGKRGNTARKKRQRLCSGVHRFPEHRTASKDQRQTQMTPSCAVGRLDQLRHIRAIQDPLLVRGSRNKQQASRSEEQYFERHQGISSGQYTTHLQPTPGIMAHAVSIR